MNSSGSNFKRARVLVLAIFALCPSLVQSQEFSPEIELILRQVMAENGFLTEEMHRRFWLEINKASPKDAEMLVEGLRATMLATQEYQREVWDSARISYENRKVVRTDRLAELESRLLSEFKKQLPWPEESSEYEEALAAYNTRRMQSDANKERLLKAAANHGSLELAKGQMLPIDDEQISLVLGNLNASYQRLERLLDPTWK